MPKDKQKPKTWKETVAQHRKSRPRLTIHSIEWGCEWISYRFSRWALLEVLEYVGKLSLLAALIVWLYPGCQQRKQAAADARKSKHYIAWQTINSAVGKPGNAGRADALQDLNQDGVHLDGISLSGNTILQGPLRLTNASMTRADFSGGVYLKIDFSRGSFYLSKWDATLSEDCDFRGASFSGVNLIRAQFFRCDFGYLEEGKQKKNTVFASRLLSDAAHNVNAFMLCNFANAEAPEGYWDSVSFINCNFAYAKLNNISIGSQADLEFCNLFGTTTDSLQLIKWAYNKQVVFTNVVSMERWSYLCTNQLVTFRSRSPAFMEWASNQFILHIKTNDAQAWLDWRDENLR